MNVPGALDDPVHEAYACGRALGMTQHEAHKATGRSGKRSAASEMERNAPSTSNGAYKAIRERIREIQAHLLTTSDVTPEVVLTMLTHEALTAKSDSARVTAQTRLGQIHAMFVEKRIEERREYNVAAMLKVIAGDNPALMHRLAAQIPLMPGEKATIEG